MAEKEPKSSASPSTRHYGAAPGVGIIDFSVLPAGAQETVVPILAEDGMASRGFLYRRGGERTVVCISHPRGDMSRHYAIPTLLEAGFAVYGHQCRGLNNDVDCEHERLLLDLAAAFHHLRSELGFEKLVLFGNSGGGSLMSFYQEQASIDPPDRLTDTAAGEACDLNKVTLPKADGLILIGAHPGEGEFILNAIDPSVIDERDAYATDPALDMFNPANGYRQPPESSSYSEDFLKRYREAQHARVARLDAQARGWIAQSAHYKAMMAETRYDSLPAAEKSYIARRAKVAPYMIIYRTEANPAYCDLSLHAWKSTRRVGSLIGTDPEALNYSPGGFARYLTPRAWLSSWSALSTRAAIQTCLRSVRDPLLMVCYTADNGCFPDDNQAQVDACAAADKTIDFIDCDHYGRPFDERQKAVDIVAGWLRQRFE